MEKYYACVELGAYICAWDKIRINHWIEMFSGRRLQNSVLDISSGFNSNY